MMLSTSQSFEPLHMTWITRILPLVGPDGTDMRRVFGPQQLSVDLLPVSGTSDLRLGFAWVRPRHCQILPTIREYNRVSIIMAFKPKIECSQEFCARAQDGPYEWPGSNIKVECGWGIMHLHAGLRCVPFKRRAGCLHLSTA